MATVTSQDERKPIGFYEEGEGEDVMPRLVRKEITARMAARYDQLIVEVADPEAAIQRLRAGHAVATYNPITESE